MESSINPSLLRLPNQESTESSRVFLAKEIRSIGMARLTALAKRAAKNRSLSYSPYSNYCVGVTLLSTSGKVYDGANAERASYSETDHGEESAVTAGILAGEVKKSGRKFIRALAVSHASDTAPCGRCRQILIEHCDDCVILMVNVDGTITGITNLKTLLPYSFSPTDLGK